MLSRFCAGLRKSGKGANTGLGSSTVASGTVTLLESSASIFCRLLVGIVLAATGSAMGFAEIGLIAGSEGALSGEVTGNSTGATGATIGLASAFLIGGSEGALSGEVAGNSTGATGATIGLTSAFLTGTVVGAGAAGFGAGAAGFGAGAGSGWFQSDAMPISESSSVSVSIFSSDFCFGIGI